MHRRLAHLELADDPALEQHDEAVGDVEELVEVGTDHHDAGARVARLEQALADVGGRVVATEDGGRTFRRLALKQAEPLTSVVEAGENRFALTGPRGVAVATYADR